MTAVVIAAVTTVAVCALMWGIDVAVGTVRAIRFRRADEAFYEVTSVAGRGW